MPGGFEDWAYGASWSEQVEPTCKTSNGNGNTSVKRDAFTAANYTYTESSNRCLVYLIETSEDKEPEPHTLGKSNRFKFLVQP